MRFVWTTADLGSVIRKSWLFASTSESSASAFRFFKVTLALPFRAIEYERVCTGKTWHLKLDDITFVYFEVMKLYAEPSAESEAPYWAQTGISRACLSRLTARISGTCCSYQRRNTSVDDRMGRAAETLENGQLW